MSAGERRIQFSMRAGTVTLDLVQLKQVVGCAMSNARNELNRVEREMFSLLERACRAERDGDTHEHYRLLCNANTSKGDLVRYARQYEEAVEAYFHVCEAIKRDRIEIVRE